MITNNGTCYSGRGGGNVSLKENVSSSYKQKANIVGVERVVKQRQIENGNVCIRCKV